MLKIIDGHGLTARAVFRAESMSLNLSEKDSTAAVTVTTSASNIKTGEWVQDLEDPGKNIVWRVKSIDDQRDTGTKTINLEHLINTLKDRIIPTEVKTTDISGGSTATARQAINKILSYQSDWQLGTFDYDSVSAPYHFDGETLRAALDTVSGTLEDPVWEFNFSSYPFKINIRQLSASADSEMRGGRNLTTIKITEDRSQMYTRFYPRGKNNLKLSGNGYIEKNTSQYGVIEKTETDSAQGSEAELTTWANERLNRHARPGHTVTISGLELSASTGEDLDKLRIGHKCQVPLPEDGETITEKITKLSWKDKIKDPRAVTVTLADALEDVASIIAQEQQKSGGGSRAAAKANEENALLIGEVETGLYSVIAQTSTSIYQHVHNEIEGVMSTIMQTATAIMLSVSSTKSDLYSTITQTSTSITLAVASAKSDLYSQIEQTASSINLSVATAKSSLWSSIMMTSTQITLKVGKGEVISCINQTAEAITINASRIDLSGYVTASDLSSVNAKIDNLTTGVTKANYIKTTQFLISDNYFTLGEGNIRLRTININGTDHHLLGTD